MKSLEPMWSSWRWHWSLPKQSFGEGGKVNELGVTTTIEKPSSTPKPNAWRPLCFLSSLFLFINTLDVFEKWIVKHCTRLPLLMKVKMGRKLACGLTDIRADCLKPISKALIAFSVHRWVTRGTFNFATVGYVIFVLNMLFHDCLISLYVCCPKNYHKYTI